MEIWLDTIDLKTIEHAHSLEILHGATTNPTILAEVKGSLDPLFLEILDRLDGPLAIQVIEKTKDLMVAQARKLMKFSARLIIKIPATHEGYFAMQELVEEGIPVMATAIFDLSQAYLSLKLGASYIAPYLGRIEDEKKDPGKLLSAIAEIKKTYDFEGKTLAAGIRSLEHFELALMNQADAITLPKKIYDQWLNAPNGTHIALEKFDEASKKIQSKILS